MCLKYHVSQYLLLREGCNSVSHTWPALCSEVPLYFLYSIYNNSPGHWVHTPLCNRPHIFSTINNVSKGITDFRFNCDMKEKKKYFHFGKQTWWNQEFHWDLTKLK